MIGLYVIQHKTNNALTFSLINLDLVKDLLIYENKLDNIFLLLLLQVKRSKQENPAAA